MSDLKDELERERREKEWAETWKPSGPGDALIGTLEGYDEATTDFGTYTVAHVRNEDGVLKGLWLMHSVLKDEWEEAAPEKGDRVGAMYHGKRSGDSYDYHMWSVRVDRSEGGGTNTAEDRAPQKSAGAEARDSDGREQARQIYGGGEDNGATSALDDPNADLLF